MILCPYRIDDSTIPGAGRGIRLLRAVSRGDVLVAPTQASDIFASRFSSREQGDCNDLAPQIADARYINHSFEPAGHWHLGFVFATRDLLAGTELTIDYRLLAEAACCLPFVDGASGQMVIGFSQEEARRAGLERLQEITGYQPFAPGMDG